MSVGSEFKSSGITKDSPENMLLGAGTIHKGLKYDPVKKAWNFSESLLFATSGGSKLKIKPTFTDYDVDGATVKIKGFQRKTGETATLETNPIEITPEVFKMSLVGDEKDSEIAEGYKEITSRALITEGDYLENLAYVGKKANGTPVIIIFDYAICTSGLELEGKNKEASTPTLEFECVAETSPEADRLPWHIFYPKADAEANTNTDAGNKGKTE